MSFSLDDYIDVAERVVHFRELYPDGTLQQVNWEIREIGNQKFVVYTAAAYRNPDDPRPGMGTAWEPFPGTTPYTRNSELMNAETAAWGRAIVALGLTSNRKLASRQEVKARREEQNAPKPKPAPRSDIPADATDLRGPQPAATKPQDTSDPLGNDEMFAVEMAGYMRQLELNEPQPFREFMSSMGVDLPSDLRAKDTRLGVLKGLTLEKALEITDALKKRMTEKEKFAS
jgi:hypothetical protein